MSVYAGLRAEADAEVLTTRREELSNEGFWTCILQVLLPPEASFFSSA